MVEPQPSKLAMPVRSRSPAPHVATGQGPVGPSGAALKEPSDGPLQGPGDPAFHSIDHGLVTPPLLVTTIGHAASSRPCRAAIRPAIPSTGTPSRSAAARA